MVSEPSWGPCLGQGPLKWTEISPTTDPSMIWDDIEAFYNDRFCKLKPEYISKRIILFFRIQNIHSKQIIIFFKNLEYSFKKSFFLKIQNIC